MWLWAREEGKLGVHSSSSSSRCVWFGCLSERQQRPRSSSCLSPPAFIFPPPCLRVGGEKLEALSSPPSGTERPAGARTSSSSTISSESTWCTHSGHFLLKAATSSLDSCFFCGFLCFAAALLGPVWPGPGSDG